MKNEKELEKIKVKLIRKSRVEIITLIISVILTALIFIGIIKFLDYKIRKYNIETAKMGVDWKTSTCYLYWD